MTFKKLQKAAMGTLCVLACASTAAAKAPVDVDANEQARAAQTIGNSKKLALSAIQSRHIDGAKGYKVYPSAEGPTLNQPEQLRKLIAKMACNGAVFGLVELEGAKTFVGKNDIGIFTKYRFRVLDDWRAAPTGRGQTVHLIVHGGEVSRGGQTYRVENPYANYQVGSQYVLLTGTKQEDGEHKTIFDTPPFLEVSDDIIHPAPGWTPFAPGVTTEHAKRVVNDAVAKEGCL